MAKASGWGETKGTTNDVTCYGLTRGFTFQQEVYETASRDAAKRANFLRACGFKKVTVAALGPQVTRVGTVKLSMVTIADLERFAVPPAPARLEKL